MNSTVKPTRNTVHTFLMDLIRSKYNVHLEVAHIPNPDDMMGDEFKPKRGLVKVCTCIAAFNNKTEAINGDTEPMAMGFAYCTEGDQFVRRKGLAIAARRLYKKLKEVA